jgi:hypothetical protein
MMAIDSINELQQGLTNRFEELHQLKSNYDLKEQDILHYIEFEKYDAVTGSKLLKSLKKVRIDRRNIKDEYEELQSILMRLKNAGLKNYKRPQKTYTYRIISLDQVLSE